VKTIEEITTTIVSRFRNIGIAQVTGYNSFSYIRETDNAVIIGRECGSDARVPIATIREAVKIVRSNPHVYNDGPGSLANYGITHVNSPIWAMLHLIPLEEILR
jgi:hypothetical protein